MNKNLLIACLLILIAGGVYAYFGNDPAFRARQLPTFSGAESTNPMQTAGTPKHAVTWKFETVVAEKPGADVIPLTKVIVTWDGQSHDAGTYQGSCAEIDGSTGTLSENEVSGALCWFAGAGDEIGIFSEDGKFALKHGEQQEPSGEGEGFRGNFKALLTL